ncbi:hypothetical protein AMJ39_04125 [candidate division TA06 bacterium DG_24]|uniref:HEPN domain-containing protein n=2 Tax=Bacteria division TA06 TaxID=1156500 RepID=A0A0S8GG09_UNCT6|nr:MAG: hypothetical protein AMJ39_04125 [candidate division TA06 bacterium DG_24]KPK70570.1 MAG: hypothetical protein AMJ82_02905 [candidate division TA06 bacterium SM23_40]
MKIAQVLTAHDLDWAHNLAYNSMLQSCLALMQVHGYRTRGPERHKTAIMFAQSVLGEAWKSRLKRLDRIRRRRHRAVYEVAGLVSEQEATDSISLAIEFSSEILR